MTDKEQSEALRLAALLDAEEWPGSMTVVSYARECVAELLRQHGELETLRTGYAAARLEIESLRAAQPAGAQQPGAAYAARPDEREAFEAMMRSQTFDSLKRLSDGSYESYEARVGWLAWNARASHGQAPAQEDEYPALVCDYCGALTPDPWHSSGMMNGKMSKHIHSCDVCFRGAAQAAPAGESLRTDALCDLSYSHGLKAGWNYCASDDLAGFERAQKIGAEALRTLKSTTAQAAPAELLPVVDRLLVDAYSAGLNDDEFDMLSAKAKVAALFSDAQAAPVDAAKLPSPANVGTAPKQEAQEPYGWLYDWTHSSATGKPDTTYTGFTKDEAHARKHDNCTAVFTKPQPSPAAQGDK